METIFYSLLLAIPLGFFCLSLLEWHQKIKEQKNLQTDEDDGDKKSLIDYLFYPLFSRQAPLFQKLRLNGHRQHLKKRFIQADVQKKYNEEIFWSFQCFMALVFVGLYYGFTWYLHILNFEIGYHLEYCLLLGIVGFVYPHLWLSSKIKKRSKEIIKVFPDFVSTLTLSVEAGMDYFGSMVRYIETADKTSLRDEIEKVVKEVRLGSNRETALKSFASRVALQPITNFVAILVQATQLGTSIGIVLKAQAEKLRRERFEAAERAGALASQKILFPLIFFIMPAVFLLIFGPLIVRLVSGGLESLFM